MCVHNTLDTMDDDTMSTPLAKLPPPLLQTKQETGPITTPSYDELRKSVAIPRQDTAPSFDQPPQLSTQQPQFQQQQFQQQQFAQQQFQQQPQLQQQSQYDARYDPMMAPPPITPQHYYHETGGPMQDYQARDYQSQYEPSIAPLPPPRRKKKRPSSLLSFETLKKKQLWAFAVIVFLIIAYGLPRLRALFPSIIDPLTGSTKFPALAALSVSSGLFFVSISEYI